MLPISFVLLLTAAALMFAHVRAWRAFRQRQGDAEDFDYRRRQFRRRMQTSALLGLSGVALALGQMLTLWFGSPWFAVACWGATMLLLCWIGLLALVDIWATKHHFGRLGHHCLVEEMRLQAEARRLQAAGANGKPRHVRPPDAAPKRQEKEDAH